MKKEKEEEGEEVNTAHITFTHFSSCRFIKTEISSSFVGAWWIANIVLGILLFLILAIFLIMRCRNCGLFAPILASEIDDSIDCGIDNVSSDAREQYLHYNVDNNSQIGAGHVNGSLTPVVIITPELESQPPSPEHEYAETFTSFTMASMIDAGSSLSVDSGIDNVSINTREQYLSYDTDNRSQIGTDDADSYLVPEVDITLELEQPSSSTENENENETFTVARLGLSVDSGLDIVSINTREHHLTQDIDNNSRIGTVHPDDYLVAVTPETDPRPSSLLSPEQEYAETLTEALTLDASSNLSVKRSMDDESIDAREQYLTLDNNIQMGTVHADGNLVPVSPTVVDITPESQLLPPPPLSSPPPTSSLPSSPSSPPEQKCVEMVETDSGTDDVIPIREEKEQFTDESHYDVPQKDIPCIFDDHYDIPQRKYEEQPRSD